MARLTLIIYTIEKHHRGLPCGWRREATKEHSGRLANANIVTFTTLFIPDNYTGKYFFSKSYTQYGNLSELISVEQFTKE